MSYLEHPDDHCKTAQDVRTAAFRVSNLRRSQRQPRLVELVHEAEKILPPKPVVKPIIEIIPIADPPAKIHQIQRTTCKKFGVDFIDFMSRRKTKNLTVPRQVSYVLSRALTLKSLPDIGNHHRRDHTTVLCALRKYQWLTDRLRLELTPADSISTWVDRAHALVTEGNGG